MLKKLLVFAVGVYTGIYADQHYQIAKVDEPAEMYKKVIEYLEQYKKSKND